MEGSLRVSTKKLKEDLDNNVKVLMKEKLTKKNMASVLFTATSPHSWLKEIKPHIASHSCYYYWET